MAGLVRRIALREILPGCTGAKHPQDSIQDLPPIARRPTLAIATPTSLRDQGLYDCPLGIREIHGDFPMRGASEFREFAETGHTKVASTQTGFSGF